MLVQPGMFSALTRAALPRPMAIQRGFVRFQSGGAGSFFEEVKEVSKNPATDVESVSDIKIEYETNKDLRQHPYIKEKINPVGETAAQSLLSNLKQALYAKVLAANNGQYVNNQTVELDGKSYKLSLTREEQKALVPSVYAESYRIKSSWKKMFMFLRMFRRMDLTNAITQCQFSNRRMARDIAEMLLRAKDDAVKLGMNPETMIVDQIWVGKDGNDMKRMQSKGRGRTGIITHPYVHVKAILKDKSVLEQREQWMKKRLDRKLWVPLRNWKIKEDYVQTADYKW